MAAETLEQRVEKLENKIHEVEERLIAQTGKSTPIKRGWRAILGVDAGNPLFDEAVRLGQEWRYSDRPESEEK